MNAKQDRIAADPEQGAQTPKPDSTGTNSRPRNDSISQTGPGFPDDSSEPVAVDPAEEQRIAERIRSL